MEQRAPHRDRDHHTTGAPSAWLLLLCGWLLGGAALTRGPESDGPQPTRGGLDLQRATLAELRALPGLGARRAVDLARARWDSAPAALEPLSVHGIGPKTVAALHDAPDLPAP